MMAYNLVLYIICGFVIHSWILPLYSIVTYGAALKTVDFIVEGLDRSKAATIVTVWDDDHRGEGILFGFPEDSGVHRGKPFSGWEDERTGS